MCSHMAAALKKDMRKPRRARRFNHSQGVVERRKGGHFGGDSILRETNGHRPQGGRLAVNQKLVMRAAAAAATQRFIAMKLSGVTESASIPHSTRNSANSGPVPAENEFVIMK